MVKRLNGKNAIVTAAGQGIGKATAITFHNEGAKVTATDINNETLADLNKEYPNISVKKLDVMQLHLEPYSLHLGKIELNKAQIL